jgi:CRP/FNR family transcriptional regulator, anaerobic regulatory protein
MSNPTLQRTVAEVAEPVDDGDEHRFCSTCTFGQVCLPNGFDKAALRDLHCLVEHVGPFRAGHHVFRVDTPFDALYSVRAGMVKTCTVDELGREQVLGFHLPGELVGLSAIYPARYPCDAIALDTIALCRFSFPAMLTMSTRLPGIQEQLFRLMSKDIGAAALLAGDFSADERVASFLVDLSNRYASRGYSATRFRLSMPRADIANYLRLAAETVSRVLRRFQDKQMIAVCGREVVLLDPQRLRHLSRCALPEYATPARTGS